MTSYFVIKYIKHFTKPILVTSLRIPLNLYRLLRHRVLWLLHSHLLVMLIQFAMIGASLQFLDLWSQLYIYIYSPIILVSIFYGYLLPHHTCFTSNLCFSYSRDPVFDTIQVIGWMKTTPRLWNKIRIYSSKMSYYQV